MSANPFQQYNEVMKPMKCESCGAPMKDKEKCEYCGMEYSVERVPIYDESAKIKLDKKFPIWEIDEMRY
jgi:rRNA maturation endonuclease Nob1